MTRVDDFHVLILGGGAAGFFTALALADACPQARITILEAGTRPLQKVKISGGGRCNLTHACLDPRALAANYPRGEKALLSLFSRFGPAETMHWFQSHGLPLMTEPDGRVFPASGRSQDVIDLLLAQARAHGIALHTGVRVTAIAARPEGGFFVSRADDNTAALSADAMMLATGYSPSGWRLAESLGHRIIPPVPSLFPFRAQCPLLDGLAGITLKGVSGNLWVGGKRVAQARGELLITHQGVSGPLAYRLSAWGARALAEAGYQAELRLDLAPDITPDMLITKLTSLADNTYARQHVGNVVFDDLPKRFWRALLADTGIAPETRADQLPKAAVRRLAERLKRTILPITGRSPSKEEFVSCGGVALGEVDFRHMASRVQPGLYFAGEILDIDGLTGGFNFQACWSAGWVAAQAMASRLSQMSSKTP